MVEVPSMKRYHEAADLVEDWKQELMRLDLDAQEQLHFAAALLSTRKTKSLSLPIVDNLVRWWNAFPTDVVAAGIRTYLKLECWADGKAENYLQGIIRHEYDRRLRTAQGRFSDLSGAGARLDRPWPQPKGDEVGEPRREPRLPCVPGSRADRDRQAG